MPDYNAMRQDAVRRAIEMQSRAQKPEVHIGGERKEEDKKASASTPSPSVSSPLQSSSSLKNGEGFLQVLFKDSERTLILLLLLLISTEETDPALLFALLYLCL